MGVWSISVRSTTKSEKWTHLGHVRMSDMVRGKEIYMYKFMENVEIYVYERADLRLSERPFPSYVSELYHP